MDSKPVPVPGGRAPVGLALLVGLTAVSPGDAWAGSPLTAATAAPAPSLKGVHVFGWGFDRAADITSNGTDVWVANGASVVELSAATGALVRVISGLDYGFAHITSITSDSAHAWGAEC